MPHMVEREMADDAIALAVRAGIVHAALNRDRTGAPVPHLQRDIAERREVPMPVRRRQSDARPRLPMADGHDPGSAARRV